MKYEDTLLIPIDLVALGIGHRAKIAFWFETLFMEPWLLLALVAFAVFRLILGLEGAASGLVLVVNAHDGFELDILVKLLGSLSLLLFLKYNLYN